MKRLKDEIRRLTNYASDLNVRARASAASSDAALESSFIGGSGNRAPLQAVNRNSLNQDNVQPKSYSNLDKLNTENDETKPKLTSKEIYINTMAKLEKGKWQGAGSGIMKEDALDFAKHRVIVLEKDLAKSDKEIEKRDKEIAQREKIERQIRHEREVYYKAGGEWKTKFKQLEYKVAKKGCMDCRQFVSQEETIDICK